MRPSNRAQRRDAVGCSLIPYCSSSGKQCNLDRRRRKGAHVPGIQGSVEPEAFYQIRIRDKWAAENNRVSPPTVYGRFCRCPGEATHGKQGAGVNGTQEIDRVEPRRSPGRSQSWTRTLIASATCRSRRPGPSTLTVPWLMARYPPTSICGGYTTTRWVCNGSLDRLFRGCNGPARCSSRKERH